MKPSLLCLFIALALLTFGCESPIPDPIDPRMTKYTTTGENGASAYYNTTQIWELDYGCFFRRPENEDCTDHSALVSNQADTVELWINGNPFSIRFVLTGKTLEQLSYAPGRLNNTHYDLSGNEAYAEIFRGGNPLTGEYFYPDEPLRSEVGNLYIRNATRAEGSSIILSGTFGFDCREPSGKLHQFHKGRFDLMITPNHYIVR